MVDHRVGLADARERQRQPDAVQNSAVALAALKEKLVPVGRSGRRWVTNWPLASSAYKRVSSGRPSAPASVRNARDTRVSFRLKPKSRNWMAVLGIRLTRRPKGLSFASMSASLAGSTT
jgi:hypothetical protein